MKIGIIGIGSLTLELAIRSAGAGYKITLHNPRGNSLIRETAEKWDQMSPLTALRRPRRQSSYFYFFQRMIWSLFCRSCQICQEK